MLSPRFVWMVILAGIAASVSGLAVDARAADDAPRTAERPNIILISLDTVRPDHLGCYGYQRKTSANIDRIAKEGVVFTQAFSQACTTFPSHLAIFTSQYPTQAWLNWQLDETDGSTQTLPDCCNVQGISPRRLPAWPCSTTIIAIC